MSPINDFINATDTYRHIRDEWEIDVSRPGFYDPQDNQKQRAKEQLAKAEEAFIKAFKALVEIVKE